jgi:hypothetical protein
VENRLKQNYSVHKKKLEIGLTNMIIGQEKEENFTQMAKHTRVIDYTKITVSSQTMFHALNSTIPTGNRKFF